MKLRMAPLVSTWSRLITVSVLVIALLAGPLTGIVHAESSYRVQPGDSLISIAARYNTTVDAIVAANGLQSNTIYAGQQLVIPSPGSNPAPQASQPAAPGTTYTVQPGDTLSEIALRYGTTTDALARANGLGSTAIYAGQVLQIAPPSAAPAPTPRPAAAPPASPGSYVVQSGDNLITLAARFGIARERLAAANGLSPSSLLYIGQVLKIPGPADAVPASTQTPPPTAQPPAVAATTTPQPEAPPQSVDPGKPVQYTVKSGDSLSGIAAKFNTTTAALAGMNKLSDGNFLRVGQVLTIVKGNDQNNTSPSITPVPEPTPPMGSFGPKWIEVNLSAQQMVAFEGQTAVYTARISSGVPQHPTVEGTYRIYAKYVATDMKGGEGADYYYLPHVPYTMYFYSGYALHGTYWHNNFGQPMSHGCVNLPDDASKWMFGWAPIGTMVVTHR